jgi:hypothetical protein
MSEWSDEETDDLLIRKTLHADGEYPLRKPE